jgi:FkbH-like protein
MNAAVDPLTAVLEAPTRAELDRALRATDRELSLVEVNRLTRKLRGLNEATQPLRVGILHTYTTELLRPHWELTALLRGFALDLHEAPYGSLLAEVQPDSALLRHQPDVVFAFLRWKDLDPRLRGPLPAVPTSQRDELIQAMLEPLRVLLTSFRQAAATPIVLTLLPAMSGPALGLHDAMAPDSDAEFRVAFKHRLAAWLRDSVPAAYFDDLDELLADVGRRQFFDARLWYTSRYPFSVTGARAVAERLMTYAVLLKTPRAKCIVLDADNTLWGGIVGEDGPDGIALGPDYPGSVFVAFQRRLLDFQQRGLLLALCSKNNEADVLEVLRQHPHQLVREQHFAALRVNWSPKPANLRGLAAELNLGLDTFVFVDDSPHECLAVRQELPQITVVQRPAALPDVPRCLDHLPTLEVLGLTEEDRQRTELYVQERRRRELRASAGDVDQYLRSLNMRMTIGVNDTRQVARIAQLTQRTNQFNLTTRRYSEADIRQWMTDPDRLVAHFRLTDVFGDSGLVGVALVRGVCGPTAEFDSFLLSCRVIGRQAETAFLHALLELLRQRGVRRVEASYVPTKKNALVKDFWPQHGFTSTGEDRAASPGEDRFTLDLAAAPPAATAPPGAGAPITIQWAEESPDGSV